MDPFREMTEDPAAYEILPFLHSNVRKILDTTEKLQKDLDKWLKHYNEERAHQGYRNRGKRPIDTIKQFVKNVA